MIDVHEKEGKKEGAHPEFSDIWVISSRRVTELFPHLRGLVDLEMVILSPHLLSSNKPLQGQKRLSHSPGGNSPISVKFCAQLRITPSKPYVLHDIYM